MEVERRANEALNSFHHVLAKGLESRTREFIRDRVLFCEKITDGQALHKQLKIPYIKMHLPDWSADTFIAEAQRVSGLFVPHRSSDSRGWRSLCLHGIDDISTLSPDRYGYENEDLTPYRWTDASEKCPITTAWLKQLVDQGYFTKLYRVRFMWLEPGGYIQFHRDRPEGRNSLGPLNIALNMPDECHWLFRDFGNVPFTAGTALSVDISNEHGVWNNSNQHRVHLIVHGQYGPAYYRSIAKEKVKLLEDAKLKLAAETQISYALWDYMSSTDAPELTEQTRSLTLHFLRLRSSRVLKFLQDYSLNRILHEAAQAGANWCAVVTPGFVAKEGFFKQISKLCTEANPNTGAFAYILDRKERGFGAHPQFFIVNMAAWLATGKPSFGFKEPARVEMMLPERSVENVHSDYTPLWLRRSVEHEIRKPRLFGWNMIQQFLSGGYEIKNMPQALRSQCLFIYPDQNSLALSKYLSSIDSHTQSVDELELSDHQKGVATYLNMEAGDYGRKLFLFNTEGYSDILLRHNRKPIDGLFSVAAGFKDLHILRQHGFHKKTKIMYYDISEASLFLKQYLFENWDGYDYPGMLRRLAQSRPHQLRNAIFTASPDEIEKRWKAELIHWGNADLFAQFFATVKECDKQFVKTDIVHDPEFIPRRLAETSGESIAIWYSNCFNYTPALAQQNWQIDKLENAGRRFSAKLAHIAQDQGHWIECYGEDFIFGARSELTMSQAHRLYE